MQSLRSLCCLCLFIPWLWLAPVPSKADAAEPNRAEQYRRVINRHISARWTEEQVEPSPRADDATFHRRVWLDIAGTAPAGGVTRSFLEDDSADKRQRLVHQLLDSPQYIERFAEQWLKLLIPETTSDQQLAYVGEEFRSWLRLQALNRTPYDEFAKKLLSVRLSGNASRGAMAYYSSSVEPRPTAFYAAKDTAPENLAAATARVFLGIRVDCAQCHDHPFADWKQDDFWSYAAFYQGLGKSPQDPTQFLRDLFFQGAKDEVTIPVPETDRLVSAKFLDGQTPQLVGKQPREVVADWMVSADNPFFARAAVNRVWAELLGRGLVDPVDDMDAANPPSHPELLDALAALFAEDFDTPALIEGIVLSEPYQRSSAQTHSTQDAPELFARFLPRRLDAKQVHRSLTEALQIQRQQVAVGINYNTSVVALQGAFDSFTAPLERTASVQQALLMMNGPFVQRQVRPNSPAVSAWSQIPGLTPTERVELAYISILGRLPDAGERERMVKHLGQRKKLREGLADISWALVNSAEFVTNH